MDKKQLSSDQPVGLVLNVYRDIGVGMLESVYGPCFAGELAEDGLDFQQAAAMPRSENNRKRKPKPNYCVDLVINGKMIVELKGGAPEVS